MAAITFDNNPLMIGRTTENLIQKLEHELSTNNEEATNSSGQPTLEGDQKTILVVTIGTRGDVQPFLSFSAGLVLRGYRVVFCTHRVFQPYVEEAGFPQFVGLGGNPSDILSSPEFQHAFYHGSLTEQTTVLMNGMDEYLEENYRIVWNAARTHQVAAILYSITTLSECVSVGQRLSIPVYAVSTIPFMPSSEIPPVAGIAKPFSLGFMNSFAHWGSYKILWMIFKDRVNRFRADIGLPEWSTYDPSGLPCVCIYSSLIQPRPLDWGSEIAVTGFCVVPLGNDFVPPQDLADYLAAGPPPVYLGFGSMPLEDPLEVIRQFHQVVKALGFRGIVCSGWSQLPDEYREPQTDIMVIKGAPHEWLFPRCSMAIHHGGAGTVAASTRAGIPTVIFPVLGDQPFWAHRLAELGVAPKEVYTIRELNALTLQNQIVAASAQPVIDAARKFGEELRKEDGVANFVRWFDQRFTEERNTTDIQAVWVPDSAVQNCAACQAAFSFFLWRKHCRSCGSVFCADCVREIPLPAYGAPQKVCLPCIQARFPKLLEPSSSSDPTSSIPQTSDEFSEISF